MILIDYNQIFLATFFANEKYYKTQIDPGLIRHQILTFILSLKNKFKKDYGDVVICSDGANYWRKQEFPYYKSHRKGKRDADSRDWHLIFKELNDVRNELIEIFPYRVINVDGAEGDDVVATICINYHKQEKIIIISSDLDFQQLQKYPGVTQYSPLRKKIIKCDNPELYLQECIIEGDKGDGVPNILSDDDALANPDKKQSAVTKKFISKLLISTDLNSELDEITLRNYYRNKTLIDLDLIPIDIKTKIIEAYENANMGSKSKILNYFIKNKLNILIEQINNF